MKRRAVHSFLLCLAVGFAVIPHTAQAAETCANDMVSRVQGGDGCFAIDIVGDPDIEPGKPLVVFMHGDGGASKHGKYFGSYADQFRMLAERKINVLAIARPAYRLPNGPTTGIRARFNKDPYTLPVVDGLAAALKALKAHYRPSRLVLLGHSGGSMISGIILGRHPGLADDAVLVSWACNTRQWRQWRINSAGKRKQWLRRLSAHDHIARVPVTTRVVAMTGERDRNTLPRFAKQCVEAMIAHGIDARFDLVTTPDARGHDSVMRSPAVTRTVMEVTGVGR